MPLYNAILTTLREKLPQAAGKQLDVLARAILDQIENSESNLAYLPDALVAGALPPAIQVMMANDYSSIAEAAQFVVGRIEIHLNEDQKAVIPPTYRTDRYCPYPGLEAFSDKNTNYFFGREDEVDSFYKKAIERPMIALTGPSGVGKSSFIAAGVVPRLRKKFGDKGIYLSYSLSVDGNLLENFAEFLGEHTGRTADVLSETLKEQEDGLLAIMQGAFGRTHQRVFLVLDQFESLFVGEEAVYEQERRCLVNHLLYAEAHQPSHFLTILLATRENFFEHSAYTSRARLRSIVQRENVSLSALNDVQLRRAIERPLLAFNQRHGQQIRYQAGLVDLIVTQFRNTAVSLPLVQYLLQLLWIEKHHLTHFAYNSLGRLERVLDRHAAEIYEGLPDESKTLLEAILILLVRFGIDGEHTRKRIRHDNLLSHLERSQRQKIEHILARLTNGGSRLISEQQIGKTVYLELTHEIILHQWTLLRNLIATHKEWIELRESLLPKADAWQATVEIDGDIGDRGELFRGNELKRAQQYVESAPYAEVIEGTIAACFEASQRYQRQLLLRRVSFGSIVSIVVFLVIYALFNQAIDAGERADENATAQAVAVEARATTEYEATIEGIPRATAEAEGTTQAVGRATAESQASIKSQEALSRALMEEAAALRATQPDLATLLSIEAHRIDQNVDSQSALFKAVEPDWERLLHGHVAGVTAIDFSDDGRLLASGDQDAAILLWDVEAGQLLSDPLLGHEDAITSVAFAPSGEILATSSADGVVLLWDVVTQQQIDEPLLVAEVPINEVAFSPDGVVLAAVGGQLWEFDDDGALTFWNVGERRQMGETIRGFGASISSVAFSPDGTTVALGLENYTVELWDVEQQERIGLPMGDPPAGIGHSDAVMSVAFSPDGQQVASGGRLFGPANEGGEVFIWDVATQTVLNGPMTSSADEVTSLAFSPDGQHLFSNGGFGNRSLIQWFVNFPGSNRVFEYSDVHAVKVVDTSRDGRLATGLDNGTIILWHANTFRDIENPWHPLVQQLWSTTAPEEEYISRVDEIAFGAGGTQLSMWYEAGAMIWNLETYETIETSWLRPTLGQLIALSPTQDVAAIVEEGHLVLQNIMSGEVIHNITTLEPVKFVDFSVDGTTLRTLEENTVKLRDVVTGEVVRSSKITENSIFNKSFAFSPDNNYVAFGSSEERIIVWDIERSQITAIVEGTGGAGNLIFYPQQNLLAWSNSQKIFFADVETGELIGLPISGHTDGITLSVSSDGKMLASGALERDGTLRLWDVASRQAIGTIDLGDLIGRGTNVQIIQFHPENQLLAVLAYVRPVFGGGYYVFLVDLDVNSWATKACEIVNRNLTLGEWQQYIGSEPYQKTCPHLHR